MIMLEQLVVLLSEFLIISTGANVAILEPHSLANGNACECGKHLTLSCMFKNDTFAIAWMNPYDITPIAQCVSHNCAINPEYINLYNISYDKKEGIFNLTIMKLTMKDNGRKFVCSDGTNIDSKMLRVQNFEPLIVEDTENGTIKAISGCVVQNTNVSFKWIKIFTKSKSEKEINFKILQNETENCSASNECGQDNQKKYIEVVQAKRRQDGFFLKIIALYGNGHNESYKTDEKFTFEEQEEDTPNKTIIYIIVIAVIVVVIDLIIAGIVFIFIKRRKTKSRQNTYGNTTEECGKLSKVKKDNKKHNQSQEVSNQGDEEQRRLLIQKIQYRQNRNDLRSNDVSSENQTVNELDSNQVLFDNDEIENYLSVEDASEITMQTQVPKINTETDMSSINKTVKSLTITSEKQKEDQLLDIHLTENDICKLSNELENDKEEHVSAEELSEIDPHQVLDMQICDGNENLITKIIKIGLQLPSALLKSDEMEDHFAESITTVGPHKLPKMPDNDDKEDLSINQHKEYDPYNVPGVLEDDRKELSAEGPTMVISHPFPDVLKKDGHNLSFEDIAKNDEIPIVIGFQKDQGAPENNKQEDKVKYLQEHGREGAIIPSRENERHLIQNVLENG